MKKILVVIDGLGDLPNEKLGNKTPLEAANKPHLDEFSKKSILGYNYPISEDYAPESDTAVVALLGNDPNISSRGEFEALGYDIKTKRGDLVLRANFGTIDNLESRNVLDRRAGRTLTTNEAKQLALAINKQVKLPVKFHFFPTIQHRGVLVFYGGFSDNVTNTDTYVHENGKISVKDRFDWSKPLDEEDNSEFTANLINSFIDQSYKILRDHPINNIRVKRGLLPANIILARDPGVEKPELRKFKKAMAIVNMPLEKGIAKLAGMQIFSHDYPKMKNYDVYENLEKGLGFMCDFAVKTLKKQSNKFNFCYIHFKETDIPGHDNKPLEKKRFIEILDKNFFRFFAKYAEENKISVLVTADHSTPCRLKTHTADSVPVLFFDPEKSGESKSLGESNAKQGKLGKVYGKNLLKKVGFLD